MGDAKLESGWKCAKFEHEERKVTRGVSTVAEGGRRRGTEPVLLGESRRASSIGARSEEKSKSKEDARGESWSHTAGRRCA